MDYRVNIKIRNANILRAIEKSGHQPGGILAREIGISYQTLLDYCNLKRAPFDENGDLRSCAEKICVFLNRMPSDLWSEDQLCPLRTNAAEVDISAASVQELLSSHHDFADPLALLERKRTEKTIDAALDMLLPQQADVLRMRFGIGGKSMTLDEIASEKKVTRERIRQIESKALRRMREKKIRHVLEGA